MPQLLMVLLLCQKRYYLKAPFLFAPLMAKWKTNRIKRTDFYCIQTITVLYKRWVRSVRGRRRWRKRKSLIPTFNPLPLSISPGCFGVSLKHNRMHYCYYPLAAASLGVPKVVSVIAKLLQLFWTNLYYYFSSGGWVAFAVCLSVFHSGIWLHVCLCKLFRNISFGSNNKVQSLPHSHQVTYRCKHND